jgi:sec-independent protein translocase protein TatC
MTKAPKGLAWLFLAPILLAWWLVTLPFRFIAWLLRPVGQRIRLGRLYRFFTETPEERDALDAISDAFREPESILEHLEDIRKHLFRALAVLAVAVLASFYFTEDLVQFLAGPAGGLQNLQAIEVTESISVFMRVALLMGVAVASPYIAFEIWLFAAPGLYPRERLVGLLSIPFALVFFVAGAWFAYQFMLPTALPFLLDFLGIEARLRPASYFNFVTGLMFWLGVAFEFPLVMFALSSMGLVRPGLLLRHWRIAIILMAILSAAITPTVDPVNMALVMGPLIALYFLGIFFSWIASLARGGRPKDAPTGN